MTRRNMTEEVRRLIEQPELTIIPGGRRLLRRSRMAPLLLSYIWWLRRDRVKREDLPEAG